MNEGSRRLVGFGNSCLQVFEEQNVHPGSDEQSYLVSYEASKISDCVECVSGVWGSNQVPELFGLREMFGRHHGL